ncbi:MAG: precorrin-2 C(20)-methyltransferase [Synechococcus sp.]|nr:precorrin-2 C(20)-methyltransferase [Synechococcus sp.]
MAAKTSAPLVLMGVGPGDPELLTLKAHRHLCAADVVAYPVARPDAKGMASAIVAPFLDPSQRSLPLVFPMVTEAEHLLKAWRQAAAVLAEQVHRGHRVVFLCEGDVSLFATGSYVLLALQRHHPEINVEVIPGISSVAAAAAAGHWPLAFQKEGLLIRPCPDTPEGLDMLLQQAESAEMVLALLKLGVRWHWIQPLLKARGLLDRALFAERVGWPDQRVLPAAKVQAGERPYFSLLLVRHSADAVLP